jgi:hypothetical protein
MRGDEIHLWEVGASKPVERQDGSLNRYPGYTNLRFAVVARTMQRVMELATEQYPDIVFHTIQKRNYMGEAHVLIDPEVTYHDREAAIARDPQTLS